MVGGEEEGEQSTAETVTLLAEGLVAQRLLVQAQGLVMQWEEDRVVRVREAVRETEEHAVFGVELPPLELGYLESELGQQQEGVVLPVEEGQGQQESQPDGEDHEVHIAVHCAQMLLKEAKLREQELKQQAVAAVRSQFREQVQRAIRVENRRRAREEQWARASEVVTDKGETIKWYQTVDGDDYWTDDEFYISHLKPRKAPDLER
jgi:hypothetical protein